MPKCDFSKVADELLECVDHFVGFVLEGLIFCVMYIHTKLLTLMGREQ